MTVRGIDDKELVEKTTKILNDTAKEMTVLSETEGKVNLYRLFHLVDKYEDSMKRVRYCVENYLPDDVWVEHKKKWFAQIDSDLGRESIPRDITNVLEMLVARGDDNAFVRYTIISSIKSMLKPYPGYTYRRGDGFRDSHGRLKKDVLNE